LRERASADLFLRLQVVPVALAVAEVEEEGVTAAALLPTPALPLGVDAEVEVEAATPAENEVVELFEEVELELLVWPGGTQFDPVKPAGMVGFVLA
jgi:hypothetical protein